MTVIDRTEQVYNEWLVLRCQSGDRDAIEALVEHWHGQLVRFATVVLREPDLAHEAVQDAWLAIIRGLPRIRDPSRCHSWMLRIVHNKCRDLMRRRVPEGELASEPAGRLQLSKLEDREEIDQVLATLSNDHRAVLALHYLHDMEVTAIADLLRVPAGTIKSRLHHAREAFRRAMELEEEDEPTGSKNSDGAVANG